MRLPTAPRIWFSLCLIGAGLILFPAYKHWVSTRTWVVVDMPISLAPGHIKSGNFPINISTDYHIGIQLQGHDWRYPDCLDYEIIQTRWWLFRDGHVTYRWVDFWANYFNETSDSPARGSYLGTFQSGHGFYNLDIEMVSDATCLQPYHPHLRVYADDDDYVRGGFVYEMALFGSFALIGIAVAFLLISSLVPLETKIRHGDSLAIFHTLVLNHEPTRRKLLLMGPASTLPTIGYVYALTCLILFLVNAPFYLADWRQNYGLRARTLLPGIIQPNTDQETGLLVYVDQHGGMYLNSKPIAAEQLQHALEVELSRRPDWSVYVEGDLNVEYQAVIRAMDLVRSAHGEVIMLTPKMRAEGQAQPF